MVEKHTSIIIDDVLWKAVKIRAVTEGKSLKEVLKKLLEGYING